MTGSGKTRPLEQANILVINVPNDRAKHRLNNDMLSVRIPIVSYPSYARWKLEGQHYYGAV